MDHVEFHKADRHGQPSKRIATVNGYHVIAQGPNRSKATNADKGTIVLCYRHDCTFDQFVTWLVWDNGIESVPYDVAHGHYLPTLTDALMDFNERSYGEVH